MSDPYGHDDWTDEERLEALRWAARLGQWEVISPSGQDDTAAVQAAFDRAVQAGKRGVLLEGGTYHVTGPPAQHGLEFRGEGEEQP